MNPDPPSVTWLPDSAPPRTAATATATATAHGVPHLRAAWPAPRTATATGTATHTATRAVEPTTVPPPDAAMALALLDRIAAPVLAIDRHGRCVFANRERLAWLGAAPEDVVGRPLAAVLGGDVDGCYAPAAARVWAGESMRLEGWTDDPVRGRRHLDETFVPCSFDAAGGVQTVAVVGRDRTELKLRERELAGKLLELSASEALKSAIVDHALAALISTDEAGAIVEFNPAAEAMFGHARAAVLGRLVSEVVMPLRFRAAHDAGMRRMHAGEPSRVLGKRLELAALRADGSEFAIEMVLWRTAVAESVFYTSSIVDITGRQVAAREIERQRDALRQSEKLNAMGSLLAGVAHELNNPLAIVMGRAGLLEECCADGGVPEAAQLRADLRQIRAAADRCGRIVRTFLDMARSRPARRERVDLNTIVGAAAEMLRHGCRSRGIALEVALHEPLPPLHADADQIGQIVMNLIVNAQQSLGALPPWAAADARQRSAGQAPRLDVRTGVDPAQADGSARVWLRVADNGPGIDPALRGRIFEPFFTTKPEGAGTGLGLSMAREMARQHGGDLLLETGDAAGGASFRLQLPAAAASTLAVPDEPDGPPPPAAQAQPSPLARLLVVDDEPELAELLRAMLESAGYEVAVAESGQVALELLAVARFDAVVSDLRMPGLDGAALWRELAARQPALAGAVLFVTGDTLSADAQAFLQRSGCAALEKPFSKADLLVRVAAILR